MLPDDPPLGSLASIDRAIRYKAMLRGETPPDVLETEAARERLRAEEHRSGRFTQAAEVNEERKAAGLRALRHGEQDAAQDGEQDAAQTSHADRLRTALVKGDDIRNIPPPEPLVAGLLYRDTVALFYGPSGEFKSFVLQDLCLSVATGTWWHGRKVTAGPVLYIVAEGLRGMGVRVDAWQERRRVWTCGDLFWLPMAVNLLDWSTVAALSEVVADLSAVLVVIDTVARCMPGADENSSRDMGLAIEGAETVRRASGACVAFVHHTGKDPTAGARGSSALRAAVSTEIECRAAGDVVTLTTTKQKDHEGGGVVRLSAVQVGESLALDPYHGEQGLPRGAVQLLEELAQIAQDDGVSSAVWKASSGVAERSFYRWQKSLVDLGYCQKQGEKAQARYTVSDLGKQVMET